MFLLLFQTLLTLQIVHSSSSQTNNLCTTWQAYNTYTTSPECSYFEDIKLDQREVIIKHTGCIQSHHVLTEDGYILTMQRLCPRAFSKGIVFLHPTMFTDAGIYLKQGNDSLAFYMWKRGYDVWIANMRGTPYSTFHLKYRYDEPAYWNWSLTEVGEYDVKAEILYIKNQTNGPIYYMGHSLGTTVGLIFASKWPELSDRYIKHYTFMATSTTLEASDHSIMAVAEFEPLVKYLIKKKYTNLLFFRTFAVYVGGFLQKRLPFAGYLANLFLQRYVGKSDVVDPAFFNLDVMQNEKTISVKCLSHYFQLINIGTRFQEYDYGVEGNVIEYGTEKPPQFKYFQISSKMLFLSGKNDLVSSVTDVVIFIEKYIAPASIDWRHVIIPGMNHLDFATAKNRPELFYYIIEAELDRL